MLITYEKGIQPQNTSRIAEKRQNPQNRRYSREESQLDDTFDLQDKTLAPSTPIQLNEAQKLTIGSHYTFSQDLTLSCKTLCFSYATDLQQCDCQVFGLHS